VLVLELVGLDPDADAAYAALLSGQPRTAEDLTAATGLPHPRLRAALRALQAHNQILPRPGLPSRYVALDPAIALDLLLLQREGQIKRARALVLALSEGFRHYQRRRPAPPAESRDGDPSLLDG
jgi:HTH-type transcriptional regulator, sugar sensing transcriptional regulator